MLARVKDPKDVDYVRDQILATFKQFTTEMIPQAKLDATRSRLRYSFAMAMNSSDAIAGTLAPFIALRRTPDTIDKLAALMETITPKDVRDMAAKYFVDDNRTIVTLATKAKETAKTDVEGGRATNETPDNLHARFSFSDDSNCGYSETCKTTRPRNSPA